MVGKGATGWDGEPTGEISLISEVGEPDQPRSIERFVFFLTGRAGLWGLFGWGVPSSHWRNQKGLRVITFDLPGFSETLISREDGSIPNALRR